ncbi:MAG TPA: hypothetical protein VL992_01360 [Tepidisphaeraceae bacterium]|nr:hypothetical protein [Tepidisphaeraceae bacterium]
MNAVVRRIGILSLVVGLAGLAGCGGAQADNAAAEAQLAQADTEFGTNQIDQAITDTSAVTALQEISPDVAARAQSLLGELKLVRARELLAKAQDADLAANRLLADLRLSVSRVSAIQAQIQSETGLDPSEAINLLKQRIAEAQGDTGQTQWPTPGVEGQSPDAATLSTLSAVQDRIAQVQGQIQDNRSQATNLSDQRTQVLGQADDMQQKSLADTGKQSVDDVAAAADQRRQAADLAISIDKLDSALVQLNADVANLQVQRDGVQQVITDYNKQIDDLNLSWQSAQQDIQKEKEALAALIGPASTDASAPNTEPGTILDQCVALKQMIISSRDLRNQAGTALTEAFNAFQAAASAGRNLGDEFTSQLSSDRTTPMETLAIQQLQETYSSSDANLDAAETATDLAINYADQAMIGAAATSTMQAAQAALGSDAPTTIADCITAIGTPSVDDLFKSAYDRFEQAMNLFDNEKIQALRGPGAEGRKTMALSGKMVAAFAAKQLSIAMANKPVVGMTPADLQGVIDDLANQLVARDPTKLPAVPYTLAPPSTNPQQ